MVPDGYHGELTWCDHHTLVSVVSENAKITRGSMDDFHRRGELRDVGVGVGGAGDTSVQGSWPANFKDSG